MNAFPAAVVLDPSACRHCGRDACAGDCRRVFVRIEEGHYRFDVADLGVVFTVDRLRRERSELHGELAVRCALPGALTEAGVLAVADLNLSSQRAREERARYLAGRARTQQEVDWTGLLDGFVQRVLDAERNGQPAVLLCDIPRPKADDVLDVGGFPLLARHPVIAFGDGGAAKSYLALYLAGLLDQAGHRVGLFDWELAGEDHRERAERLWPGNLPALRYVRCTKPLAYEVDRLRRVVRDERLDYVVLDSIAFACDGPPEAAEVASRYFQATRQLGTVGSLHVAHISKAEGADMKPFGSAFWHNGARATWFVKLAESAIPERVTIGCYNRKANMGPQRPAIGYEIAFADDRTTFRRVNVADTPDLAGQLSVRQRMLYALRTGAMSAESLADEIDAKADTVRRTAARYPKQFTLVDGGKVGLLERRP